MLAARATNDLFEFRAWPGDTTLHTRALRDLFTVNRLEERVDHYFLSSARSQWLMKIRGERKFEIKVQVGLQGPLAVWRRAVSVPFPLRRGVLRSLQDAFPGSELPAVLSTPDELRQCLQDEAFVCRVSKRRLKLQKGPCRAEITEVNANGRRATCFALEAETFELAADALHALPKPLLPNIDYGAWLKSRLRGHPPVKLVAANR